MQGASWAWQLSRRHGSGGRRPAQAPLSSARTTTPTHTHLSEQWLESCPAGRRWPRRRPPAAAPPAARTGATRRVGVGLRPDQLSGLRCPSTCSGQAAAAFQPFRPLLHRSTKQREAPRGAAPAAARASRLPSRGSRRPAWPQSCAGPAQHGTRVRRRKGAAGKDCSGSGCQAGIYAARCGLSRVPSGRSPWRQNPTQQPRQPTHGKQHVAGSAEAAQQARNQPQAEEHRNP